MYIVRLKYCYFLLLEIVLEIDRNFVLTRKRQKSLQNRKKATKER